MCVVCVCVFVPDLIYSTWICNETYSTGPKLRPTNKFFLTHETFYKNCIRPRNPAAWHGSKSDLCNPHEYALSTVYSFQSIICVQK